MEGMCPFCEELRCDIRPSYMAEVICTKCLHRWIAVWPVGTWLKNLECPNCGPGYVIKTGQDLEDEDDHKEM